MSFHDRRPKTEVDKFTNAKYRAFWQSSHWETLQTFINDTIDKLSKEMPTGETTDAYLMSSLRRDGRIDGLRFLLKEIERLANKDK